MSANGRLRCTDGEFSGTLESAVFYAGDDAVQFGDFYVSANGSNIMESNSGYITISQGNVPSGYGIITVSGAGSTTTIKQGQINCREIYLSGSWWDGWSLTEEIQLLHDAVFG